MAGETIIAHLTDIHISPNGERVRDVNVRYNFEITLQDIVRSEPDLLVLGGDQAARTGEMEAYEWIKPHLDRTEIPYVLIPGNHDSIDNLDRVFELGKDRKGERLYFSRSIEGRKLIFLDTSMEIVDNEQLQWLEHECRKDETPALLFMHHPPLFCNCTFMDRKYPLRNREDVFAIIRGLPGVCHVFCGHYHTEKTVQEQGISVYLTPSTMLQMSQENDDYAVSTTMPGWRLIRWDGSRMETSVRYIFPA